MTSDLLWIDAGRRFGFDDLVFRHDRQRPFAQVAGAIDTIVLGPHASAAFPAELHPFIAPALTRRKQCDFSDIITASLGRAWVAADPRVVYVENPVSRLVLDPNRAPPADPIAGLREFYQRLARQRAGESVSFGGVDAVRPITFGGEDVLAEPGSPAAWQTLATTLADVAARTVAAYRACCDEVLRTVLERRPANAPLRVFSLHDTMNTKMRADGAIVVERAPADRLPLWANLGNKGDAHGNAQDDPITLDGAELRRIAAAWADGFGLQGAARDEQILLNRPYKGAYETVHYGARLRALGQPRVGAVQVEFLRETLLGPAAVARLHAPGTDWPAVDEAYIAGIAAALARAGQALRAG
jgi:hypothetical protein